MKTQVQKDREAALVVKETAKTLTPAETTELAELRAVAV